jgi:hypothetical protein
MARSVAAAAGAAPGSEASMATTAPAGRRWRFISERQCLTRECEHCLLGRKEVRLSGTHLVAKTSEAILVAT